MKFKSLILGTILATALSTSCFAQDINVNLNGSVINFENQKPVVVEGRTLIPLRGVFDKMGYNISWDGTKKQVTLSKSTGTIIISIGSSSFTVNEKTVSLDVPAQIINGSTMLPLRAIADATGAEVLWDAPTKMATIVDTSEISLKPQQKNVTINNNDEKNYISSYTQTFEEFNKVATKFYECCNQLNTAGVTSETQLKEINDVSQSLYNAADKAKNTISSLSTPEKYLKLKTATIEYMQALMDTAKLLTDLSSGTISPDEYQEKMNATFTNALLKENNYKTIFESLK